MGRSDARLVRYAVPLMIVMNILWGASYLAADIGMQSMSPGRLAAWRFLVASSLLFPLLAVTRTPMSLRRADTLRVVVIGFLAVAVTYMLTYVGIQFSSSTDRAAVSPLEPVALAVLSAIFLRERLARRQWLGIAVACAGAYLLATREMHSGGTFTNRQGLGAVLILISFLTEGMYSILGKPLLQRYRALTLTAWSMLFAAFFLFLYVGLTEGWPAPPPHGRAWGALLYLAVPCTVIGYTLWYILLEHMPAGVLGAFIFIQPVVGILLGILFRDERLTAALLIGAALIVLGVSLTGLASAAEPIPDPEPSA